MKIMNLYGVDPPKKLVNNKVEEVRQKKIEKKDSNTKDISAVSNDVANNDQVEISKEAKELQSKHDEVAVSKQLLSKLPSTRAHIIYEALAKIRAGMFSSDKIAEEAATKLLDSGELNNII